MNPGKITEPQCKRSVLKWLPQPQEDVIQGVGVDYVSMQYPEHTLSVSAMASVSLPTSEPEQYAYWKALNKLTSGGAVPRAVMANLFLPARGNETRIRSMVQRLAELCTSDHISYIGGHTELSEDLRAPIITVVAYGYRWTDRSYPDIRQVRSGDSIVCIGHVALEATSMLATDGWEQLKTRYASSYLENAKKSSRNLSLVPIYTLLFDGCEASDGNLNPEIAYIHDLSTGGIFAGLWELGERTGCGIDVSLKSIPIIQETIEVCDYFDINPYMAGSSGSALVVTSQGEKLVEFLEKRGISSIIIGQITNQNDRIVRNDEVRFLTPPKGDELYKYYLRKRTE